MRQLLFLILLGLLICVQVACTSKAKEASAGYNGYVSTEKIDGTLPLNQQTNKQFLDNAAKNAAFTKTESGLLYRVINDAEGAKPTVNQSVEVHYEGKLINGKIFDSSYKRGESTSFGLTQVIPGWTEGLQLMPVGSTYEFIIPSQIAYGSRAMGADIPPHSTLIFRVDLIAIK